MGLPYNPFKSCVVPRPIAWVSSISDDGIVNLAPFSHVQPARLRSAARDVLGQLTGSAPGTARTASPTPSETGEFVVNMATYDLREKVAASCEVRANPTSTSSRSRALTKAGLASMVKPPRVAESPVNLECVLSLDADHFRRTAATRMHRVVIGRVVGIHIRDDVLEPTARSTSRKSARWRGSATRTTPASTEVFSMKPQGGAAGHGRRSGRGTAQGRGLSAPSRVTIRRGR